MAHEPTDSPVTNLKIGKENVHHFIYSNTIDVFPLLLVLDQEVVLLFA